jgi:hypothetical protein
MLPFLDVEEERSVLTDVLHHFESAVVPKLPSLRAQVGWFTEILSLKTFVCFIALVAKTLGYYEW